MTELEKDLEEVLCKFHAVSGMLSLLWEATEGNVAVCDSVYGIRALLNGALEELHAKLVEVR